MTDGKKTMGRPSKGVAALSEQVPVKVTAAERDAIDRCVEQLNIEAQRAGFPAAYSRGYYIRTLIQRDLTARGLIGADAPSGAVDAPPTAPVPPVGQEAASPSAAAAAILPLQPERSAPPARAVMSESNIAPAEPAKEPSAAAPVERITAASVRRLMDKAYDLGLSRDELAERSGVPRDKLSRFRNPDDPRGELKPDKLTAVHGALRRWLDEQETSK